MGIGNLNTNFGRLTANNVANKKVTKNNEKTETLNINTKANANSLNSATLGEYEGNVFDSNNIFGNFNEKSDVSIKGDKNTVENKDKKENKEPKTHSEFVEDEWKKRGGMDKYTGKDSEEMSTSVLTIATIRWAWSKITSKISG